MIVRMNISLPAELREQMKTLEATKGVNWSEIAAKAFHAAICRSKILQQIEHIPTDELESILKSRRTP